MFASDLWRLKPVWPYSTFSWQIMSWNLIANCLQTAVFRRSRLKMYLYRPIFGLLWPMATWLFLPRCLACWLRESGRICFFTKQNPTTELLLVVSRWIWMDMNGHEWTWHLRRTGSLVKWKAQARPYFYGLVGDELRIARGGLSVSYTLQSPVDAAVLRSPFHHSIVYPAISGWNFCMHPDRYVVPWLWTAS